MSEAAPLRPGMIVGILGGGQLGRMLAMAAAELGLSCHIYCPDPKSPAFAVAAARTIAPYDDESALAAFAGAVDIVTFEFENIPVVDGALPRGPGRRLPRRRARSNRRRTGSPRSGWLPASASRSPLIAEVSKQADIYSALARTGRPAILKTRRLGYDGKGQALIRAGDDPVASWRAVGETPAILEAHIAFEREVSVIVARGRDGAIPRLRRDRERPRGRDPRDEHGAGRDPRRRRRAKPSTLPRGSPTRSAMSASSRWRCSWPLAARVRG